MIEKYSPLLDCGDLLQQIQAGQAVVGFAVRKLRGETRSIFAQSFSAQASFRLDAIGSFFSGGELAAIFAFFAVRGDRDQCWLALGAEHAELHGRLTRRREVVFQDLELDRDFLTRLSRRDRTKLHLFEGRLLGEPAHRLAN